MRYTEPFPHHANCPRPFAVEFVDRGRVRRHCAGCDRYRDVEPPVETPANGRRYWLGCDHCGQGMWFPNNRPRLALCPACHDNRRNTQRRRTTQPKETR